MKWPPGITNTSRRSFVTGSAAIATWTLAGCGNKRPFSYVGHQFPDFDLRDIDGNAHRLSHQAQKPIVANFWATWCPPCRTEMPELEQVHQQNASRGLSILGFCIDDDPNPVREFRLRVKVSFPLIIDAGRKLMDEIGINSLPTTLLIDRHGIVKEVLVAPRPWLDYPGIKALLTT
jgi:peroxiredoxin